MMSSNVFFVRSTVQTPKYKIYFDINNESSKFSYLQILQNQKMTNN